MRRTIDREAIDLDGWPPVETLAPFTGQAHPL